MIDALEFHGHLPPVDFAIATAISGHAQHGLILRGCLISNDIIPHPGALAYAISEN